MPRRTAVENLEPRIVAAGDYAASMAHLAAAPGAIVSIAPITYGPTRPNIESNASDLDLALEEGYAHLTRILDRGNSYAPFYTAWWLSSSQAQEYGDPAANRAPTAHMAFDRHFVSNVSGRAVHAILTAAQSLSKPLPLATYETLKSFVIKSLHRPANGDWLDESPGNKIVTGIASDPAAYGSLQFDTTYLFNMGAALKGTMAAAAFGPNPAATLPGYAWSTRHVFEQSVENIRRYYVYAGEIGGPRVYDWERFRSHFGLRGGAAYGSDLNSELDANWSNLWNGYADPFLIGDLVDYYQTTGHAASLELAKELRDLAFYQRFPLAAGNVPLASFTHMYEVVGEMNAYSRLALVLGDADMMERVRTRYEVLREHVFGPSGWVPESWGRTSDVGDAANTAELIETALNFAKWGWTQYYQDVERFTRGFLLPSQLLDTSRIQTNPHPANDGEWNIAPRLRGAFGFAAPYGPVATNNPYYTGGVFTTVTAAAVSTLAEIKNAAYEFRGQEHRVNLLFDVSNDYIDVTSPYSGNGLLEIRAKTEGNVLVQLPAWADRAEISASLAAQGLVYEFGPDWLLVRRPPVNQGISIVMPLAEERQEVLLNGREMIIDWRGDAIVAMSGLDTPLPFFAAPYIPPSPNPVNVTATADNSTRLSISWQIGEARPESFLITIAEGDAGVAQQTAVDVGLGTFHTFANLNPGTQYTVRISPRDATGRVSPGVTTTLSTQVAEKINTHDIDRALSAGMSHLANIQDADNSNIPFFYVWALTNAQSAQYGDPAPGGGTRPFMGFERHLVSNVAGRSLYALSLAGEALGVAPPDAVWQNFRRYALKSLHKSQNGNWNDATPANQMLTGLAADPRAYGSQRFDFNLLFNVGAGMWGALAMAALASDPFATLPGYTWSARHVFEQAVDNFRRYYVYPRTIGGTRVYDWEQFRSQFGLTGGATWTGNIATETQSNWSNLWRNWADPFFVYSLVKYYERTGHQPTLELAKELRDLAFYRNFPTTAAAVPVGTFGHMHEVMGEMAAYSRLALVLGDEDMMNRVRVRYERLRGTGFSATGWVPETLGRNSDVGEINNSGFLVETAINFAQFGWTEYYEDAERFTRAHILPAQLLDTSFVIATPLPANDGQRDIANRIRGAFGFPAPYGHVATKGPYYTGGYYTDITAGALVSLAEIRAAAYRFLPSSAGSPSVHVVNLLFDVDNEQIAVVSPYPAGDRLIVTPKTAGDVRIRIPSWADRASMAASLAGQGLLYTMDEHFVRIGSPAPGKAFHITLPLAAVRQSMVVNGRMIAVDWRGDTVTAMSRMNTALPFFPTV